VTCDEKYRGLFLPEAMLREFAKNPEHELSESFLNHALGKGDECYGFLDGTSLVSYGWYSRLPTQTDWANLAVHFDDRYIYMYKGFTHVNNRGQRLYALGMTRALQEYLARGYKGMVAYVEWNNFDSLKSAYRMGYKKFGTIYSLRIFNRYFLHSNAGCGRYQFRLERVRPSGERKLQVPV
jgi:hypothetical protein